MTPDAGSSGNAARAFAPFRRFIREFGGKIPDGLIAKGDYLGVDLNRLSRYTAVTATENGIHEIWDTGPAEMMRRAELLLKRHSGITAGLQRLMSASRENGGAKKGARARLISYLHRKRANIRREMMLHAVRLIHYCRLKSGAKSVAWDALRDITARGKKGGLAKAVTNMPKRRNLLLYFMRLERSSGKPADIYVQRPAPSMVCPDNYKRTGRAERTATHVTDGDIKRISEKSEKSDKSDKSGKSGKSDKSDKSDKSGKSLAELVKENPYDWIVCKSPEPGGEPAIVNRHGAAAMVAALMLKMKRQAAAVPVIVLPAVST